MCIRDRIEADQRPILWHCSAGKDRAGWAATLVGMALGVPDDALVAHYLESNDAPGAQARIEMLTKAGMADTGAMAFVGVHADFINRGLQAVDERWSSRHAYLEETLGISDSQITKLRSELIE